MKISVVIPAYNEIQYLGSCLSALKEQSLPAHEIIVVDNNSDDRTAQLARSYGAKVINESTQGVVFARNRGFDAASGDIIARIDADTVVPPDWLQCLSQHFTNGNHQAITGPPRFYDAPLTSLFSLAYRLVVFNYNRLIIGKHILWGSNMAVRAKAWRAARPWVSSSLNMHEDLDLALALAYCGFKVSYCPGLKVGTSLRRLHCQDFPEYMQKWYKTLQLHGQKTHGLDRLVGTLITWLQPMASATIQRLQLFSDWLGIQLGWFGSGRRHIRLSSQPTTLLYAAVLFSLLRETRLI